MFLKFGLPSFSEQVEAFLPLPYGSLDNDASGVASAPESTSFDDFELSNLTPTLNVAIIVLIALGVFMFVVGLAGCAGACCSVRLLLAVVRFAI